MIFSVPMGNIWDDEIVNMRVFEDIYVYFID